MYSQQAQHTNLYPDLLQAWKEGTFDSPELPPGGGALLSASGKLTARVKNHDETNVVAATGKILLDCLPQFIFIFRESQKKINNDNEEL